MSTCPARWTASGLPTTSADRWPPIQLIVISGKVGVRPGELPDGARFMSKPYQEPALLGLVKSMIATEGGQP